MGSTCDQQKSLRVRRRFSRHAHLVLIIPSLALLFTSGLLMAAAAVAPLKLPEGLVQEMSNHYGPEARVRLLSWQMMVKEQSQVLEWQRLQHINAFLNRIPFAEDQDHWQQQDYWATPVQFLASNGGDCEDFAIAKLFSLQGANIDPDKLRLMYVTAKELGQAHMVLVYRANPGEHPLVLDNMAGEIIAARDRTDLVPVYSFNASGLWLNNRTEQNEHEVKVRNHSGSSLWRELVARMEKEGVL